MARIPFGDRNAGSTVSTFSFLECFLKLLPYLVAAPVPPFRDELVVGIQ